MDSGLVEIAAPRQTVWAFMADPSRHTELGTFVDEVTLATKGEIGEGTVYYERSGPAFMKSKSEWTITSFDLPHQLVHVGKESSMTAEATWSFEEVGSGSTRVTQSLNFQMMPGFRPLGRVLEAVFARRLMQRETARMLQDLKRIAEASARGSSNA